MDTVITLVLVNKSHGHENSVQLTGKVSSKE